ncbi:hypothetical protein K458DRAFT_408205 [Lentithecium fluviatile CBS 122367]|uniref:DUF6987 domain-containing protein n=1 Tax=Lentithecium fluviatile CBS 122367 TaxID=1168545 RepID=A0A6G1INA0_9PLEO|nr:hypothetical protein K458DRAFT_408205 [Lentithecium fluviatile CBS 122367]
MPSPAAGKGDTPRTPTKLGRKSAQGGAPKLGKKASQPEAPETDSPKLPQKPSDETLREKGADAPENVADTKEQAEETADDTQGKVSQAGDELEQAEPKPIDDTEDTVKDATDDAKAKADDAKDIAEDTAEGVEDEAEETDDNATQKAGEEGEDETNDNTEDDATDTAESAQEKGSGALSGARGLAGRASNLAGKGKNDSKGAGLFGGEDGEDGEEEGEDATEGVKGAVGDAKEGVEDTAEDAKDTAEDAKDGAEGTAEDTKATAEDTADDAKDTAEGAGDDVKDSVEDTTGQEVPGAPDLSVLKGLEVDEEGLIKNKDGKVIGRLAEGDAEDLVGYEIGDDGEILDDDGDLVGRCELTPEAAEDQLKDAKEGAEGAADGPKMPPLSILKGLSADKAGQILNEDGDFVGHLIEGDPSKIQGMEFDENGEIHDEDGNLLAKAELHPDAADLVDQNEDEDEEEGEGVTDAVGGAADHAQDVGEEAAEGAREGVEEAAEDIEDELPGVDALEGMQVNSEGDILDDDGEVVGHLAEGNIDDVKGLTVNDQGEVVDKDGNVLGKVELAEGAADKLKDSAKGALDVRILEGLKVNKKGKVLDAEGEEIGELAEGDEKECAGKTVNDKGEVVDKDGNVLGKVDVVSGEAAFEAMKELKERLGEVEEPEVKEITPDVDILKGFKVNKKGQVLNEDGEPIGELEEGELKDCAGKTINEKGEVLDKDGNVVGKVRTLPQEVPVDADEPEAEPEVKEVEITPDLDTLEGLKVNKKGQVLNEDGEPIGELEEGDPAECAGKKINEKGEVLDKDGNVIGKVRALPQMVEQKVGEAEEDAEEAAEDAEENAEEGEEGEDSNLPPLSTLEGLTVNKSGKIIDANGNIVGELVEGDAKKLSKSGITADSEGQFWDNKGHVIGRAQTVAPEEGEEESPFAGLEGLVVVKGGFVEDENGNRVGQVVEGDPKKLVGRAVDEDGDILDKKGSVVGHAERYDEPEEEPEPEPEAIDLSDLEGKTVNKQGNVIGDEGVPIARLVEGNAKELAGRKLDAEGQLWNDSGKVIGRVELIPAEEREAKPEGPFAGLVGLRVVPDGKVADEDDNIVGEIVEGNAKRLVGMAVDEDGDILDKYGNVKGHAEPLEDEEEPEPEDTSILDGLTLNKSGFLVDANGIPVGRLVEGNLKDLVGRKSDGEGQIHSDTGKVVGRCEVIPENERVTRKEGPFAGLEGLRVVKDGFVDDADGNRVGQITEGDPKRLIGNQVDEDGDIIDKYGNVKGHAEPWEEEEQEEVDLSALAGCTVNKAGNVVDSAGTILGRVAEGDPSTMIGKKVDGKGQIWDNEGNVIGRAELAKGINSTPEGPFAGFENNTVRKDGTVQTTEDEIIGRVIEGDIKRLVGHKVDEDGDINDKNGNVIGKAERWEPEEKERRINPMAGMRVNKEGEVRDENGDIIGRLTAGDLGHCAGLEIDDNGYVIDNDGNKVGEVTLLENIQEEEPEDETEEEKQRREDAELADKMAGICQQTLERVQPVCKQITEYIEQADRTPRDELDEEELVNNVKPLIEEAGRILQECNGSLRGLDPDGRIAAQAKGRSQTREATPEEYRLADCLKEITTTVVTTIDNAKKKIADMPHAKKKLNPLWSLLTEPLFQIIAAVGLLLTGVLNLVGRLLNGLGLGGLVNGLLGGLGIDKLLGGLGLGSLTEMLGGGKKEKKKGGGASSLPIVGGLMGGK